MLLADAVEQWARLNRPRLDDDEKERLRRIWSTLRVNDAGRLDVHEMTEREGRAAMLLFDRNDGPGIATTLNGIVQWARAQPRTVADGQASDGDAATDGEANGDVTGAPAFIAAADAAAESGTDRPRPRPRPRGSADDRATDDTADQDGADAADTGSADEAEAGTARTEADAEGNGEVTGPPEGERGLDEDDAIESKFEHEPADENGAAESQGKVDVGVEEDDAAKSRGKSKRKGRGKGGGAGDTRDDADNADDDAGDTRGGADDAGDTRDDADDADDDAGDTRDTRGGADDEADEVDEADDDAESDDAHERAAGARPIDPGARPRPYTGQEDRRGDAPDRLPFVSPPMAAARPVVFGLPYWLAVLTVVAVLALIAAVSLYLLV